MNVQNIVTADNIVVKAKLGNTDEIRRLPIHNPTLNYNELCFTLSRMFKNTQKLSNNVDNYVLRYLDEDGDLVALSDDVDVVHAIQQSNVLRITVFDKETMPLPTDDDDLIDNVKKLKLSSKSLASLKATLQEVKTKLEKIIGIIPEGSDDADSASKKLEKGLKTLTETELAELLSEQKKEQQHVSDTKSLVSNASATLSPQTRTASLPHPHPDHLSVTNQPQFTSANLPQQSASQPQQPPAVLSQPSSHPTQYPQPQYYSPVQMPQQYGPPSSQAPPSSAAKTLPPTPAGVPMQPMPSGPYGPVNSPLLSTYQTHLVPPSTIYPNVSTPQPHSPSLTFPVQSGHVPQTLPPSAPQNPQLQSQLQANQNRMSYAGPGGPPPQGTPIDQHHMQSQNPQPPQGYIPAQNPPGGYYNQPPPPGSAGYGRY